MSLVLRLRQSVDQPISFASLCFSDWIGKSVVEVLEWTIDEGVVGEKPRRIGDLFELTEEGDSAVDWRIEGDFSRCSHLGAGLRSGRLSIVGPAGDFVGEAASGGRIEVHGDCGDFAASALRGGTVVVCGSVGDFLGGPPRGSRVGIKGGSVFVAGDAGRYVGHRLRRGMIVVAGDVGEGCGWEMIAGTLVVGGRVAVDCGVAMRRGSLFVTSELAATAARLTSWQPPATGTVPLLIRRISAESVFVREATCQSADQTRDGIESAPIDDFLARLESLAVRPWQRCLGDRAVGGIGEVFQAVQ